MKNADIRLRIAGLLLATVIGCQDSSYREQNSSFDDSVSDSATADAPSQPAKVSGDVLQSTVTVDLDARRPPKKLSEYGLYRDLQKKTLVDGAIPYWLNSSTFCDGALPEYYMWIPPGSSIGFRSEGPLEFPLGSVLLQNLLFPSQEPEHSDQNQLLETRLLLHLNEGWVAVPYLWNHDGTDADRVVIGEKTPVDTVRTDGTPHAFSFITPDMNQCRQCHVNEDVLRPIGPTAQNLNRTVVSPNGDVNQLQFLQQSGRLTGLPDDLKQVASLPEWTDAQNTPLEKRARAWLEVNCAHCHNPRGPAIVSGLDLSFVQTNPVRFGVYKPPVAAGRGSSGHRFSILPGQPEKSFLLHRINSTELGVMMPPVGRSTVDQAGVQLLGEWIQQMSVDEELAEAAMNPMKAYAKAASGGDPEQGKIVFHQKQKCHTCHRVGDEGGRVGPNLSDVGRRTKREYLLESIVDPNAKIVKGFETITVVTTEGQLISGVVQSEDEYELVVASALKSTRLKKADIDERIPSDVSTMPTMANVLTVDDVRHLIAYLATLQSPPKE